MLRGPSSFAAERAKGAKRCRPKNTTVTAPTTTHTQHQQEKVVGATRNAHQVGTHNAHFQHLLSTTSRGPSHLPVFDPASLSCKISYNNKRNNEFVGEKQQEKREYNYYEYILLVQQQQKLTAAEPYVGLRMQTTPSHLPHDRR